jgi:class 3 adenylate cyclase
MSLGRAKPESVDWAIDLVRLAVVGVIAGFFASYRAYRDFRRQRWWERRADAYTRLIEALSDLVSYYRAIAEADLVRADLSADRKAELDHQWSEASRLVDRAANSGAFLLSDQVAHALRDLEKTQSKHYESWFEHLDANYAAVREALRVAIAASKKDLAVGGGWSWPGRGLTRR